MEGETRSIKKRGHTEKKGGGKTEAVTFTSVLLYWREKP